MLSNLGTEGMAAEDAPGPAAVLYRWDQWILPHGTGAGSTEEGVCYWLTRLKRRHHGGTRTQAISGNPCRSRPAGRDILNPFSPERCYALCLDCQTAKTREARQVGSVADGDDFEVFGVDTKCVVLVAVVVFGERNELVTE